MRYVLCPDYVDSQYVTPHQLLDLYSVDDSISVSDCIVVPHSHELVRSEFWMDGDIILTVDVTGQYKLPKPYKMK